MLTEKTYQSQCMLRNVMQDFEHDYLNLMGCVASQGKKIRGVVVDGRYLVPQWLLSVQSREENQVPSDPTAVPCSPNWGMSGEKGNGCIK